MAAFPGLFAGQARRHAMREAVERWCLAEWAMGRLPCRALPEDIHSCSVMEILNPLDHHRVVVCWRQLTGSGHAYGFAAARTLDGAILKARIERERTAVAVREYHGRFSGFGVHDLPDDMDLFERRILYFSLPEGNEAFREICAKSADSGMPSGTPTPVVDRRIPGPWDRYTRVWRVLFPMPEIVHDTDRLDVFYW